MGNNNAKHTKITSHPLPPTPMATNQTADHPAAAWSELLGSNNWDGLLDPLDLNLRTHILRCGNFCQATYDAFNNDQNSKYCGSSRYGKHSFFDKVMLQDAANYQVSCFLYATAQVSVPEALLLHSQSRESWDRESNWIGYIAVTTDEVSKAIGRREIYVAWRGTIRNYEWINGMGAELESVENILGSSHANGHQNHDDKDDDEDEEEVPKAMRGWLTMAYNVHFQRPEIPVYKNKRQSSTCDKNQRAEEQVQGREAEHNHDRTQSRCEFIRFERFRFGRKWGIRYPNCGFCIWLSTYRKQGTEKED
ncbi:hypothetical protein ACFX2A_026175 [Malus domestica]